MFTRSHLVRASMLAIAVAVGAGIAWFALEREDGEEEETEVTSAAALTAKISDDSARVLALAQVSGGKITEGGIETEDGKLIYSFDIAVPGKEGVEEVHIDAMTGEFLRHEHESEESEAAEKAKEVKKEKGGS